LSIADARLTIPPPETMAFNRIEEFCPYSFPTDLFPLEGKQCIAHLKS
jgi:hypothetical protein